MKFISTSRRTSYFCSPCSLYVLSSFYFFFLSFWFLPTWHILGVYQKHSWIFYFQTRSVQILSVFYDMKKLQLQSFQRILFWNFENIKNDRIFVLFFKISRWHVKCEPNNNKKNIMGQRLYKAPSVIEILMIWILLFWRNIILKVIKEPINLIMFGLYI